MYASSWSNSQFNGYSIKILLHVVKTKIYLMVVLRCFKLCDSSLSHNNTVIWYAPPVWSGFQFTEMYST